MPKPSEDPGKGAGLPKFPDRLSRLVLRCETSEKTDDQVHHGLKANINMSKVSAHQVDAWKETH